VTYGTVWHGCFLRRCDSTTEEPAVEWEVTTEEVVIKEMALALICATLPNPVEYLVNVIGVMRHVRSLEERP